MVREEKEEKEIDLSTLIGVPVYVRAYCHKRFTEIIEYFEGSDLSKFIHKNNLQWNSDTDVLFNDKGMKCFLVENTLGYSKFLIKRPVKPLTVLRNPMLKRAAYLEFQTYAVPYPVSLQEARWMLVDEYSETNCIAHNPLSVLVLIRECRNCKKSQDGKCCCKPKPYKLSLTETQELAQERRDRRNRGNNNALRSLS